MTLDMTPIPKFEGRYSVTKDGQIYSHVSNKFLKLGKTGKTGAYLHVCLGKNAPNQRVHKIILITFRGPCPEGMEGRHLDGNGHNNRLNNLEWATHSVNVLDKTIHGTAAMGEKHHACTISDADVIRLKETRKDGLSYTKLGQMFGISKSQAHRIASGQNRRGGEIE